MAHQTAPLLDDFYAKRNQWADLLSTHPAVSDRGFRIGYWLSRRMNATDQCCWYSVKRIAAEMGRSARYVQYGLAELKAANLLIVVEQKGKVSIYHMHAPFF